MSQPAALCQYDLPNGKLCRQIARKGERLCRHHMRLHRHHMYDALHEIAMAELREKLSTLSLSELLATLHSKLNQSRRAVRGCSEAELTLEIAIQRLRERHEVDLNIRQISRELAASYPGTIERDLLTESLAKSMS